MKRFRYLFSKPKPVLTREERVRLAITRLQEKHNSAVCDEECDTLVLLEELERLRRR